MGRSNTKLPNFDLMPDDGFVRQCQLIPNVLPCSQSTFWRWVRNGKFPTPTRLSAGVKAWRVGDVRAWLRNPIV